jgi:predicted methyltransferase
LFGEKKLLLEQRHDLASKEYLILGDHDKNQTAWFVVLSKIQK